MAFGAIAGKPGTYSGLTATPIEVFYGQRPERPDGFIPGPITVDGTVSADAANTPYIWLLRAGHLLGKDTTSGKYESSIIGATTVAYTSGGTSITVSAATATEIVRRVGSSGTAALKFIGPPTANGTNAVTNCTYSAVNTTTGVITCTSLGVDKVAGTLIGAADGSHIPLTLVCDLWGLKIVDALNTTRQDVFDAELYAGQGILDESKLLPVWPTDTSIQAWIKAGLRTNFPGARFKAEIINS